MSWSKLQLFNLLFYFIPQMGCELLEIWLLLLTDQVTTETLFLSRINSRKNHSTNLNDISEMITSFILAKEFNTIFVVFCCLKKLFWLNRYLGTCVNGIIIINHLVLIKFSILKFCNIYLKIEKNMKKVRIKLSNVV